ncbi:ROK family protein [Erythrobacter arachoides]|uniref:fructokinase n=1 Tax=Aurantiacibacter arachoides TaxID=1850444 RepID=A0A845A8G8_9SPHN|nr:ROK family protein [Aurantiacibacter arachoides]MXO93839.1 ROK family protein [Aurantiacibacter arachoides]GGD46319.1 fructokinase [Aurantiacibacter arachoides]
MGLIAGIEAGGTKFVAALASPDGRLLDRTRIATRAPAETFAELAEWFAATARRHGPIAAFGVASFGPLDLDPASPTHGSFTTTPKPGWSGANWHEALGQFGVPVAIDTDVNGAAMGEWMAGAGRGRRTVAYTTVGTGIGTGVVTDGRPLFGASHYEMGHVRPARPALDDGWHGNCPFHGDCLEGLVSGPAIIARWGTDLSQASEAQVMLVADYLAEFAASLALMHAPDVMIFGGGVFNTPGLLEALREKTRAKLAGYAAFYDRPLDDVIVAPALGDGAGITGAIALGRSILSNPSPPAKSR